MSKSGGLCDYHPDCALQDDEQMHICGKNFINSNTPNEKCIHFSAGTFLTPYLYNFSAVVQIIHFLVLYGTNLVLI